ncbi:MAG: hypothetical protein AAF385_09180 [Pseudomonadota bacterium]
MRELTAMENVQVSGAGPMSCDIGDAVDTASDAGFGSEFGLAFSNIYEGLVSGTSYVIGRVAGDLHPSYYL